MKIAIYVRIGTADQNQEPQIREFQEYAARRQWENRTGLSGHSIHAQLALSKSYGMRLF